MKIEKNEKALLFSETPIPDIFFAEHLSQIPGDYLKIYLYMVFLSKYNKDIKLNDLSKKLAIPLKTITEATKFLEDNKLILKKTTGYIIVDLQEATLHELYTPNLTASKETIEKTAKNKSRAKAIEHINNMYFQGIMGPSWYNDIDLWFKKYGFDEQVMIALFDYCYNRSAMHRNYVQTVAEAWGNNKIKTWTDLETYSQQEDKLLKIKKLIAKKLGKHSGLTQYEEAYIESWVLNYGYDMDIIEIALKRTTSKANPNFDYLDKLLSDWHDRGFTNSDEIQKFLLEMKQKNKNVQNLEKSSGYNKYEQRTYDNLNNLYANVKKKQEA